jgi:hypothetical protein
MEINAHSIQLSRSNSGSTPTGTPISTDTPTTSLLIDDHTTDIDAQATGTSTSQDDILVIGRQKERDATAAAMASILTSTLVGSVVGAVILLSAIAILIVIMACLIRKYKKKDPGNIKMRTSVAEKTNNTVDIDVDTNPSYVPIVAQITTENNVAYGEVTVNQDGNGLYEIMDPPIEDSTTQLARVEQSGDEYYDYVN